MSSSSGSTTRGRGGGTGGGHGHGHGHPPSPLSVRWHYGPESLYNYKDGELGDDGSTVTQSTSTPVPSNEEMQRRWDIRRGIHEETLRHRQVHLPSSASYLKHNICHTLYQRSLGLGGGKGTIRGISATSTTTTTTTTKQIRIYGEYASVTKYQSAFLSHLGGEDEIVNGQRPSSSGAVSTISIAFSPSGQTMASTHGDHTVKITACASGHLLQTLEGHPRTPWTCKYHPQMEEIVASGCLGHQVRLWNWKTNICLAMIRLDFAIISLSFHPTGQLLAIANGTKLHFWGLEQSLASEKETSSDRISSAL